MITITLVRQVSVRSTISLLDVVTDRDPIRIAPSEILVLYFEGPASPDLILVPPLELAYEELRGQAQLARWRKSR
jgi:hypothetical protein